MLTKHRRQCFFGMLTWPVIFFFIFGYVKFTRRIINGIQTCQHGNGRFPSYFDMFSNEKNGIKTGNFAMAMVTPGHLLHHMMV